MTDPRQQLAAATRRYRTAEAAQEEARQETISAVIQALRANISPTEVVRLSPFTATYVRRLAREHGVPPASPGPKRSS
ncbi:hypothetical protein KIF24_01065 [Micromonospora sp. Llam7]|uniref:hypothetical protein n=1 Tax=Micromonospora tarapacensis TaxID=2835305 RepID=UPI001C830575|nr:hypothetical protein [Micromonospora tarapacensis]MBX7264782.1 hypothetical protein [Micromonospora tarapacensis]